MPALIDDDLADFTAREVTLEGLTKRVYVAGSGPAVIVMAEMPGISPHLVRFARWVRDAGFTVRMPSLFGRDGAVPDVEEGAQVFQRACVSAEFRALGAGQSSPVTGWLRALARLVHSECGGPGTGAVVTVHLIDEAGQPTIAARDEILAFFATRLKDQHEGQLARGGRPQP
jgi:dienelactone hydrolase